MEVAFLLLGVSLDGVIKDEERCLASPGQRQLAIPQIRRVGVLDMLHRKLTFGRMLVEVHLHFVNYSLKVLFDRVHMLVQLVQTKRKLIPFVCDFHRFLWYLHIHWLCCARRLICDLCSIDECVCLLVDSFHWRDFRSLVSHCYQSHLPLPCRMTIAFKNGRHHIIWRSV